MDTKTHTPGPWKSRYLEKYGYIVENSEETGFEHGKIADVLARGGGESDANARLIAAAPALLKAAKAMLDADPSKLKDQAQAAAQLYAAIDFAEGRYL